MGRVDEITTGQLLNETQIDELQLGDAQVRQLSSPAPGVLHITFEGPVRSPDTFVYKVHALTDYVNVTVNATKMEYVGRPILIRNQTCDCVKDIDNQVEPVVGNECSTPHFRDPQLMLWKRTPVPIIQREIRHSSAISTFPWIIVYCWGNTLILKDRGRTIEKVCGLEPFRLSSFQTFHTSDVNNRLPPLLFRFLFLGYCLF